MRTPAGKWVLLIWIWPGAATAQERVVAESSLSTGRSGVQPARDSRSISFAAPEAWTGQAARTVFRSNHATARYALGPVTFERQRTAFVQQFRVPVAHFWNGRVEVACLHQRLRQINTHAAVVVPDAASSSRLTGLGVIPPHRRTSFGGGIWLRLDRPRA